MQYFKPAAGLILLIFGLLMVFVLFINFIDSKEADKNQERTTQLQETKCNGYESCVRKAETDRNWNRSISDDLVQAMKDSGSYYTHIDTCMQIKYVVPNDSILTDEMKQSVWMQAQNAFNREITHWIKATGFFSPYDEETLEEVYNKDVSECRTKYGQ